MTGGGHSYGPSRSLPYTGREAGGWRWGGATPEGYTMNHPHYGLKGFAKLLAAPHLPRFYYLRRFLAGSTKIALGFSFWYIFLDPYLLNVRGLEKKKRASSQL